MSASYYKHLGRFDLCSNRKDWQVVLTINDERVSALWDEDDEPDLTDSLPSEVLDLIEARINDPRIWRSDKQERLAKIATLRETIGAADIEWIRRRVELAQQELRRWTDLLAGVTGATA